MRYEILLAPEAVEDLKRLTARHRSTIRDHIERHLRHEPTRVTRSRIKRLRDLKRPQFRLRVGEFRIFYDVVEQTVEVIAVVAKSGAQEWLDREGEAS